MTKKIINDYAELLVKVGVNLQKKEKLVVSAPVLAADLVRAIVKSAYKHGAREVEVLWNDQEVLKLGLKYRTEKNLSVVPDWAKAQRDAFIDEKICYIAITSDDPEAMKNISPKKFSASRKARRKQARTKSDGFWARIRTKRGRKKFTPTIRLPSRLKNCGKPSFLA